MNAKIFGVTFSDSQLYDIVSMPAVAGDGSRDLYDIMGTSNRAILAATL